MADRESIHRRLERIDSLPALPTVVSKLCSMVESEETSTAEVGKLIASDQVLSARVLRLVNSAFYGFPGRIATVTHALVLLGFQVTRGFVLSASVIDMMTQGMKGMWEHSLSCSIAAGVLARHCGLLEPEEAQVAGLLHDLGKVVLSVNLPEEFAQVVQIRDRRNTSFYEAEREALDGVTHCEIAEHLAARWNLPMRLREPISLHHSPSSSRLAPQATAVVHVADAMARAAGIGSGGDPFVPRIDPAALGRLGLDTGSLKPPMHEFLRALETVDFYAFVE